MVISTHRGAWRRLGLALGGLLLGLGCATAPVGTLGYDYFVAPASNDPWTGKIQRWQARERNDSLEDAMSPVAAGPASVADPGEVSLQAAGVPARLHAKYAAFRSEQKRAQARRVAEWIQTQAQEHYVADGPIDRWATFAETLRENGDDCDGLELLTFHMLREIGFEAREVYRAVVYRRSDGQHHMVTLWFEDQKDPWVIDPTGAMTSGMPRMSELPGWAPLKVFSVDENFSVERSRAIASR
ncbi:MAG: hypothetical protein JRH16_15700 [Deltaproteobacteria bacterium]|nr:hypothetical protein [Deltaproteobacteria bacterium]MBW2360647.1 hypothetical protein [Deltaproteobacteria bacterium]